MHYGFTTQRRRVFQLVTPMRVRNRQVLDTEVRIVNRVPGKFFGFCPADVLGYTVMMSDREKTAIDCIDRPERAGATIPEDVRMHLQDLAKGSGRAYFGPRTPKPGALGYQQRWQLTANVASHELSDSAGVARPRSVDRER